MTARVGPEAAPPGPRQPSRLQVSAAFRAFALEQLGELDVVPRSMFGGVGLYCRGCFFGLIAGDCLYLKVDDRTRAEYERAGAHAFRPYPHREAAMQYYAVPLAVLENAAELAAWARKAVRVAETAASRPAGMTASRPPRRRLKPSASRRSKARARTRR